MKHLSDVLFESLLIEKLNLEDVPEDSALYNPKEYDGEPIYRRYEYFGDCKNTVDKDHMWDATQMAQWINKCGIVEPSVVLDKINNGDRIFPKKAQKIIDKLSKENKLEDTSEIVCALDDYQKIMFIYLSETDTHYFFDCKK
jgi:hypothetical protein